MKMNLFLKWSSIFSLTLVCLNCASGQDVFEDTPEIDPNAGTTGQTANVDIVDPCTTIFYFEDADNDEYGNPEVYVESCTQPDGYTTDGTDCDDASPFVNPGMDGMDDSSGNASQVYASYLFDGINNDCDEEVDEDNVSISRPPLEDMIDWRQEHADLHQGQTMQVIPLDMHSMQDILNLRP